MKLFSTRVHGVLDYLTAGMLFALPRVFGWSEAVTRLLTNASIGTLVYSVLTRYELGLIKVLPMKGHLTLDALSGGLLCAAPFTFLDEDTPVTGALVGLGAFEIMAALITETEPSFGEQAGEFADAVSDRASDTTEALRDSTLGL